MLGLTEGKRVKQDWVIGKGQETLRAFGGQVRNGRKGRKDLNVI